MIWFCISWVIHSWLQLGIHLDIQVKLWQTLWQFYQNIFLSSLASESCYSKSGYSFPDWSWVGIRDSQVKSRQSRLIRDAWTLCEGFFGGEVSGDASQEKITEIWGLQTAGNALKLSILPSPCYFSIILNILRSHQADLFSSLGGWGGGGGCVRTPRTHCLRAWIPIPNFSDRSIFCFFYFPLRAGHRHQHLQKEILVNNQLDRKTFKEEMW